MGETLATQAVFLTGGTGYMGRRLIARLLERGHAVRALVRPGSERKPGLERSGPAVCTIVVGDALDNASYSAQVPPATTFVHLVGVSHPSPWKAEQFRAVDFVSAQAAIAASFDAGIRHFVYVSVAHPAPAMRAYIEVRSECEALIRASGLNATILRPWYVLGPGHLWPYLLLPVYWLFERLPATSDGAKRLGLVTLDQMLGALVAAIENPSEGVRVYEVPDIRRLGTVPSGL